MLSNKNIKASLKYTKIFNKKKGANINAEVALLPTPKIIEQNANESEEIRKTMKLFEGIFTGISVDVINKDDIIRLYEGGCFGKGSQTRSVPAAVIHQNSLESLSDKQKQEVLVLNLEEACFLAYFHKTLKICNLQEQCMDFNCFLNAALKVHPDFVIYMAAYLYMRAKAWVVKSGIKFGGHYLIYKKGPRYYHASYLVYISRAGDNSHLQITNIRGLQRVAEAANKDLLLLELCLPTVDFIPDTIEHFHQISIKETIVRRFNMNVFAANIIPTAKRKQK